jgi:hypothetical protein
MKTLYESNKICPECKNRLVYWISEDHYLKGMKFFECEVCGWSPDRLAKNRECPNGCSDGTVCSDCPD